MLATIYATLMALGIIFASGLTSSITAIIRGRLEPGFYEALVSQTTMIALAVMLAGYLEGEATSLLGFKAPTRLGADFAASLGLVFLLVYVASKSFNSDYMPIRLKSIWEAIVVFFLLAPLGEECVFRGLIEGYLLLHASSDYLTPIVLPAVLFALIHFFSYRRAPLKTVSAAILVALLVGLIAGYYRATSGSLLPPILLHSLANIAGTAAHKGSRG